MWSRIFEKPATPDPAVRNAPIPAPKASVGEALSEIYSPEDHASGSAELGSGFVALRGNLSGTLEASMATGRMTDLRLDGKVRIEADGQGLIEKGSGPLKLRRRVRAP